MPMKFATILLLTLSLPNYEWRGRKQMIDVTVTFCLYLWFVSYGRYLSEIVG